MKYEGCGVFLALLLAATPLPCRAQVALPAGVRAVWDMDAAYHEATPTRERICIDGLWRFQPAQKAGPPPAGDWGYFKVPGPWPQYRVNAWMAEEAQTLDRNPAWQQTDFKQVDLAWYEREIVVPEAWAGRRITLSAAWVDSYAAVFLDGKQVGELNFPGGDLEITTDCHPGQKQVLSVFVAAKPRSPKIDAYVAQAPSQRGTIGAFRGLCGDVFLCSAPAGPRIDDVKADTSVRKWQLGVDAAVSGLEEGAAYTLSGQVMDGARQVLAIVSKPFTAADLASGRIVFTSAWRPGKLWDTITPQNQYDLRLSLLDGKGAVADQFLPVRFGFRELWIDGRDFYLDGTRIHGSAVPLDNAVMSPSACTYDRARATFRRLKSFGINLVYTHNYNCTAGVHLSYDEVLRAADDEGMLVSFSLPNWIDYEWPWNEKHPETTNGYPQDVAYYVRSAENHPSVVFWSTSHNVMGYSQDENPDLIDGLSPADRAPGAHPDPQGDHNVYIASLVSDVIHRFDDTRPIYHHESGNMGQMYTLNCYLDFVPMQERADWFEHWAEKGVKPLFLVEYGLPMDENWLNYREGYVLFGSPMLHELWTPEWGAQYRGDAAYRLSDDEKENIRFEAQHWRSQQMFHKSLYPHFERASFPNVNGVQAMYISDDWPAFRTWGVSAFTPWELLGRGWRLSPGVSLPAVPCATDWDHLQKPGYSPDFIPPVNSIDAGGKLADWTANSSARAFLRYSRPLLATIGGKPARFTSKDHNFLPGETVAKQAIIIDDSRHPVTCDCSWSIGLASSAKGHGAKGSKAVAVETGQQARVPISFVVPANTPPGHYQLEMSAKFSTGETQDDAFGIDVLPPATRPKPGSAGIALFDPAGETGKLLARLGVHTRPVTAGSSLAGCSMLVIGKDALAPSGPEPDLSRVPDGLKVLVFEQTKDVLEERLGFRVQEYCLRRVFPRVAAHPALAGLTAENLRDWRGAGTTVPARIPWSRLTNFKLVGNGGWEGPEGMYESWAGLDVVRPWRCGCDGSVASMLIEKPACGDFLPIVDGGFNLQYSPLMEYREGRGMVLFCQMDVTGRTEEEPAADRLAANLLAYVSAWKPAPRRQVLYAGPPEGKAHLESTGLKVADYAGGAPAAGQVLVVGPGGGQLLAPHAAAIDRWVKAGGSLLALGLGQDEANSFLPFKVATSMAEHIASDIRPQPLDGLFAGVSPSDLYVRDPRQIPLVTGGAAVIGDGVLANKANVVFCQLLPWTYDYKARNGSAWHLGNTAHNVKPTFQRASFLLSRLLANRGATPDTPLLGRFGKPPVDAESLQDLLDATYLEGGGKELVLSARWKGLSVAFATTRSSPQGWNTPAFDDSQWSAVEFPGTWYPKGPTQSGWNFYYRLKFDAPADAAGKDMTLMLGPAYDEDWVYLNGTEVGGFHGNGHPSQKCAISGALLHAGENVLAVRVLVWHDAGGVQPMGAAGQLAGEQWKRLRDPLAYLPRDGARQLWGLYLDLPTYYDDPYRYHRW